jgi:hypothetical protein
MVELLYRTTTPPGESSGIQPIPYLASGRGNSADQQRGYEIIAFGRIVASQTGVSSDMLLPEVFHCGFPPKPSFVLPGIGKLPISEETCCRDFRRGDAGCASSSFIDQWGITS